MPTNPHDPETAATGEDSGDAYSHLAEVRALRRVLSLLEAQLEQAAPGDTAMLIRLSAAIARVSDSIVRALAAHHKLQLAAEKNRLSNEWEELERAMEEHQQLLQEETGAAGRREDERAEAWRKDQEFWLTCLADAADAAAAGDTTRATEFVANVRARIQTQGYTFRPDRAHLAAVHERDAAKAGNTPQPCGSAAGSRQIYT
jgi:hypothetical protein